MFCDLRGFTSFAETVEPEDVMQVLAEYHAAMGDLVHRYEGTLERFTGDGMMVFFNDPIPVPDAPDRAVRMAVAMRGRVAQLAEEWHRRGLRPRHRHRHRPGPRDARPHRLRGALGLRRDRHPSRTSPRACATRPKAGQILISQRVHAATEELIVAPPVGELNLRGFSRPARAFDVAGLDAARART